MTVTATGATASSNVNRPSASRSGYVLVVVCLATLAITVDTTIMNITLPTLVRDMGHP